MGFFNKIAEGLKKTRDSMMGKVDALLNSFTKIDEDFFDELEESLIMADVGAVTSARICENLRKKVKEEGLSDPTAVKGALKEIIAQMLAGDEALNLSTKPSIILVIGVNGVGKTTTIGKLAHNLHEDGKKVLLAAADTFRAAAIDQLQIWADRAGVDLVKHGEGSDPAAVVFDAINAGKARGCDVVICDTAGRLHNKKNLMDELSKIARVIDREAPGSAKEVLLVLDATTGQNARQPGKAVPGGGWPDRHHPDKARRHRPRRRGHRYQGGAEHPDQIYRCRRADRRPAPVRLQRLCRGAV